MTPSEAAAGVRRGGCPLPLRGEPAGNGLRDSADAGGGRTGRRLGLSPPPSPSLSPRPLKWKRLELLQVSGESGKQQRPSPGPSSGTWVVSAPLGLREKWSSAANPEDSKPMSQTIK